jgi:hypothetical protein
MFDHTTERFIGTGIAYFDQLLTVIYFYRDSRLRWRYWRTGLHGVKFRYRTNAVNAGGRSFRISYIGSYQYGGTYHARLRGWRWNTTLVLYSRLVPYQDVMVPNFKGNI